MKKTMDEQPAATIAPLIINNNKNDNKNTITTMDEKKPKKEPLPKQVKHDERNFIFGVLNLVLSTMMISAFPHCYWLFHTVKMTGLLIHRLKKFTAIKWQYFLLDFCYMVNFWSFGAVFVAVAVSIVPPFQPWKSLISSMAPNIFRIWFAWCVGPLALSIAAFRNSLVFHNSDQIIILAVHLSPNLAVYGMRWWAGDMMATFGDLFPINCSTNIKLTHETFRNPVPLLWSSHTDEECPGSFWELGVMPALGYLCFWTLPYFAFFFVFAKNYLLKGEYHTMYTTMKDKQPLKGLLAYGGNNELLRPLIYMAVHGVLCSLTFFVLGPLLWHSFALHTLYLGALLLIAIRNSSTYYFEVFAERYSKVVHSSERADK